MTDLKLLGRALQNYAIGMVIGGLIMVAVWFLILKPIEVSSGPMFDVGDKFIYGSSVQYINDVYEDSLGVSYYAMTSFNLTSDTVNDRVTLDIKSYTGAASIVDKNMLKAPEEWFHVDESLFRALFKPAE